MLFLISRIKMKCQNFFIKTSKRAKLYDLQIHGNWSITFFVCEAETCPGFTSEADLIFTERGAEYLIIAKKGLVLASAPYAPHDSFFHQVQKHFILNFIRGICPPWFDSSGAYGPYTPRLYTPLFEWQI